MGVRRAGVGVRRDEVLATTTHFHREARSAVAISEPARTETVLGGVASLHGILRRYAPQNDKGGAPQNDREAVRQRTLLSGRQPEVAFVAREKRRDKHFGPLEESRGCSSSILPLRITAHAVFSMALIPPPTPSPCVWGRAGVGVLRDKVLATTTRLSSRLSRAQRGEPAKPKRPIRHPASLPPQDQGKPRAGRVGNADGEVASSLRSSQRQVGGCFVADASGYFVNAATNKGGAPQRCASAPYFREKAGAGWPCPKWL